MKNTLLASILVATAVNAGTTNLPAANVTVNPNYNNNTTIVSFTQGTKVLITYRGPSQFYYVSECSKPDSPSYRCDIIEETDVVLTAGDGSAAVVSMVLQDAWLLNRSGHNQWVHQQIILSGEVDVSDGTVGPTIRNK